MPEEFWVHSDPAAEEATAQLGCPAFARCRHIYMGRVAPELREHALQHVIPTTDLAPITVNETGLLVPGTRTP